MTIKIVTDSTCDLPDDVIRDLDISVVPLYINIGSVGYLDKVDITREDFYNNLPNYDSFPTTAAPGVDVFKNIYHKLAQNGATQIISIHISKSLSATINTATLAAKETNSVLVETVDSGQLSTGTGFLVETAALAAKQGLSFSEILRLIENQIKRTYVFAALDTLEFLKRSGRMNGVIAGLGSILQIKPILKMHNGLPSSEKVRTKERAIRRIKEMLIELTPLSRLAILHTNAMQEAKQLYEDIIEQTQSIQPYFMDITPVIGAHIGPNAVGFACISME